MLADGWISVEDRMPEFSEIDDAPLKVLGRDVPALYSTERVLYVVDKEPTVFVGKIQKLNSTVMPNVTHWMPLPVLPSTRKDK